MPPHAAHASRPSAPPAEPGVLATHPPITERPDGVGPARQHAQHVLGILPCRASACIALPKATHLMAH